MTHWIHPEVEDYLRGFCDPVLPAGRGVLSRDECLALARHADGLLMCMADRVDEDFLRRCPRLKVISAALKGYDNFDVAACARHGVWLTVLPDLLTAPTAELAVGLAIGLGRRLHEADRLVRAGDFRGWRPALYGQGLEGSAVGLVGMGRLGQAVARRLRGFEASLRYYDARRLGPALERQLAVRPVGFRELLETSDVIMLMLPLNAGTHRLIDVRALGRVRPEALLVNVGRGSLVDEEAVADALAEGRLGGYAADVFAFEDWLTEGRPDRVPPRLLVHPRTLWTPHLGSAVDGARRRISFAAAQQLGQALRGVRPEHEVTGSGPE